MSSNDGDDMGNRSRGQQQKDKDPRRREATTNAAPMYITIGPQCCGKSSFLRNFGNGTIKDISLDDQQDVYVPIPTETFLHAYEDKKDGDTKTDNEQDPLIQQVYQGKTLAERIRENVELILILRRWNGDSSASDFERRIKDYYEERRLDGKVAVALIETVEDFLSNQPDLPRETEVFVLESLFKPHPQTGQSAIQRAHEELRETPKHIPVAWGNTNSKPKDYERALEICHQKRRPVHFILCHPGQGSRDDDGGSNESGLMTLPWLPLKELLKRNLHRLQTQGKFVPANAIADCCKRVEAMVPPYVLKRGSDETYGNQSIEAHLVAIVSPSPGGRGPRQHDNRRPSAPFRYFLTTKHRLVQKDFSRKDYRQNNYDRNSGGRYNGGRGRGRGRGNQGRHSDNSGNNRRRYDGSGGDDERNGGYRNQLRPPPNQEDAPPRARRRYNDTGRNDGNPRSTR
eukprot:CAMPEP_0197267646 /NCGR_PEP_ID=MMETSP1432-20130617/3710_1 /TAXON_ID=44447 /ORGANISM="Pseudo-nitzschia delicatissima, Strain UNC1205" /LENGTH=456 /DNA_ID=CAMNT_0042732617 /DNA_START=199 /DNA_END=1566 /DNA_ORIENTATION=+